MPATVPLFEMVRVGGLFTAAMVLVATIVAARVLNRSVDRLATRFGHRRLFIVQFGTFLRFALFLVAIAMTVPLALDLDDQMWLALGGTAAVTIGFALKDLAASLLAGVTLLVDKPFQVGDRVTFESHYGDIVSIGLRSVRLVTLDDNLVTIPNNKFLTESVASGNAGANEMLVQRDYYVLPDQDVSRARALLTESMLTSPYAALHKPATVVVDVMQFEGNVMVRLRAKVYVRDVRFETALATDVSERAIEAFQHAGIAPYGDSVPDAARATIRQHAAHRAAVGDSLRG